MLSRILSSNSLATAATNTIKSLCLVNDEPGEEEEEEGSKSLPQKSSGIIKPQRVIIGFSLNFGGSDTQFTSSNNESESKNDISSTHENNSMISPRSVLESYCEEEEENDTIEEEKSAKVQTLPTTNITTSTMKMSTNHHTKSSISALGKSLLLSSSSNHHNDNKKLEEISGEKEENSKKMKKSEAENPCGHTSTKGSIRDPQSHNDGNGAGMTVVTNPSCEGILLRNGYNFNSSKAKANFDADSKSRTCCFSRVLCPTLGIHFDEVDREGEEEEEEEEEEECGSDDDDAMDDDVISDDGINDGDGDFLRSCFHCKRHLKQGRDIFMYRGDRAFCSSECREHHIAIDTRSAKVEQIGHNHI